MSLSFPLTVGSIPNYRQTSLPEPRQIENASIHIRQDLDHWLLTSDQYNLLYADDFNKPPSYREVLREGNPPSPFLDTP